MITIIYSEDAMEDYPEFPPCVMTTTIENEGMSWPDLMGVFARQLPKMGYNLDVNELEDAIDALLPNRRSYL